MNANSIAILMPVFNAAPWLEACLDSIINQTHTNFEVIAVDDFSTDHSLEILEKYSLQDDRIHYFLNSDKGIIPALQLAFSKSTAELITRMDADDIMPPQKLEWLYDAWIQNPKNIITGKVNYFSDKPISEGYQVYENWLNERVTNQDFNTWMYRECVLASANWLAHRDQLDVVSGFDELIYPEDYHLVLKWFEKGIQITGIDFVSHLWREHLERTSRNSVNYAQPAFFELKINHWIEHRYDSVSQLIVLGEGQKANLCKQILTNNNIPFLQAGLQARKNIIDVNDIQNYKHKQVLVTVFPPEKERQKLEQFLTKNKLEMGKNWWYV